VNIHGPFIESFKLCKDKLSNDFAFLTVFTKDCKIGGGGGFRGWKKKENKIV
jgi:hypothetical protein